MREPRFWPIPVASGAIMLTSVAFTVWVLTRPMPTTTVTVTTDEHAAAQFLIKWFDCAIGRRLPPA